MQPPIARQPGFEEQTPANQRYASPQQNFEEVSVAEIRLQEGESLENALRRFKRKVQSEDIIKEVKRHSYYLKPGEKRRVKQALARKRARKKFRKEGTSTKDARGNS
jgi:small subunit ribosomal protein S21